MEVEHKNKILGIIPARGGSKRVPKKNIRLLNNRPLIIYTIEAAKKSTKIDRLIVSTDDSEITEISQKAGAEVPFVRPAELARDDSPDKPVYLHAIQWLEKNDNYFADLISIAVLTGINVPITRDIHSLKTITLLSLIGTC